MVVLHLFMLHQFPYSIAEDANHAEWSEWQSIPQALIFAMQNSILCHVNEHQRTNKLPSL